MHTRERETTSRRSPAACTFRGSSGHAAIRHVADGQMDRADKELLTTIPDGFPVASRPYRVLGEVLGLTEQETLSRVRKLREKGFVHRIGASFDSRKLGYVSTLVGMKVAEDGLEATAKIVGSYPGVTHSYEREGEYNLWFTLIAPSAEELRGQLDEIRERTGAADMLELPAEKVFKIKVHFDMRAEAGDGQEENGVC